MLNRYTSRLLLHIFTRKLPQTSTDQQNFNSERACHQTQWVCTKSWADLCFANQKPFFKVFFWLKLCFKPEGFQTCIQTINNLLVQTLLVGFFIIKVLIANCEVKCTKGQHELYNMVQLRLKCDFENAGVHSFYLHFSDKVTLFFNLFSVILASFIGNKGSW